MSGGKFLKEWQVTDKIIEWIVFPIYIQPFTNDSNSKKIITCIGFQKFTNGYGVMCMNRGKFLKGKTSDRLNYWVNCFPIHIQPFHECFKLKT